MLIHHLPNILLLLHLESVSKSYNQFFRLWDDRELRLVHEFPRKNHILTHCDFLPDPNYCITSSNGFNRDGCEITVILKKNIQKKY